MRVMWDSYPASYREPEVQRIVRAARSGESAALIGLSGAGKSNVMGFIANRITDPKVRFVLVDCNRLAETSTDAVLGLIQRALGVPAGSGSVDAAEAAIAQTLAASTGSILCLLLDRFDGVAAHAPATLFSNLRALRDANKHRLSYVLAMRHALDSKNELAELISGNTIWLGPLGEDDARWTIRQYADRKGLKWGSDTEDVLMNVSDRYAAFLRAACEAHAAGAAAADIAMHAAVRARVEEFWQDAPSEGEILASGMQAAKLLNAHAPKRATPVFDTDKLTAKEHGLLKYLLAHPNVVCEKDDIIRNVWSEDKAFIQGVRDDSLAQLVRRLREKIEPDPATPRYITTIPGRGYKFVL
jgi:hypothetical protein